MMLLVLKLVHQRFYVNTHYSQWLILSQIFGQFIVKNLMNINNSHRNNLISIYRDALEAVEGQHCVEHYLRENPIAGKLYLLAIGKAAWAMARTNSSQARDGRAAAHRAQPRPGPAAGSLLRGRDERRHAAPAGGGEQGAMRAARCRTGTDGRGGAPGDGSSPLCRSCRPSSSRRRLSL